MPSVYPSSLAEVHDVLDVHVCIALLQAASDACTARG